MNSVETAKDIVSAPDCGGWLFALLALGFLFWAFVRYSNESAARQENEMRQRRYEEEQRTKNALAAKFGLENVYALLEKAKAGDSDAQMRVGLAYYFRRNVLAQ